MQAPLAAGTEKGVPAVLPYGPSVLPVLVRNVSEEMTTSETLPKRPVVPSTAVTCSPADRSTRELEQGPIGKNLSSAEKRKFLVNTLLGLEDSREVVYGTLDVWVAFEQDFPLASLKQALSALEKEEQWHRIVQVIKWMLSKGQGNTMRTYEQLVCALEKDNRAEEAHKIWQKKIAHDLQSVPWRFCHLMLGIYYRNNRLERLVKV
ncbi:Pentatricopeptide repeat-containing protein [Dichanthelium oligosanthes]|uniref:Pentatricopeptide repeat-containing protein n=1 Tax=Dichanthelium oligosanthes TaxID=888268 RepID=A0A1E5V9M8_9POAL|nr:Pentatricopeptide repeat-containing protein [Dichanthelium oligosanthes]